MSKMQQTTSLAFCEKYIFVVQGKLSILYDLTTLAAIVLAFHSIVEGFWLSLLLHFL